MHRTLLILFLIQSAHGAPLVEFLKSFNEFESTCDKIEVEKVFGNGIPIFKITMQDLAELGNLEYQAGVPSKKFKYNGITVAEASRFTKFNGKRVKEVFKFEKNADGTFKQLSLKRYKRSVIRYSYPLGGTICRPIE